MQKKTTKPIDARDDWIITTEQYAFDRNRNTKKYYEFFG